MFLLRMGALLLAWLFTPSANPYIVKGMKDAKKLKVVAQDPSVKGAIPIMRSKNQRGGLEFTWTTWLYIDDLEYKLGQKKHIFHKGSRNMQNNMAYPNNAPGMYLHETRNTVVIVMNTFESVNEEVEINDIPLNKWINIAIRVRDKTMDVYANGRLVQRHIFTSVPKQNYGEVFVNMNGGFSGYISDLWYHDYALTGTQIMDIVNHGPNMKMDKSMDIFPPYFSLKWFFENDEAPMGQPTSVWPLDSKNNTNI